MIDIKKIIKEEGHIRKFEGVAPEGFILVHEKTLDDLKNSYIWEQPNNCNQTSNKSNQELTSTCYKRKHHAL